MDEKFSTIVEGQQFSDPRSMVNSKMKADGRPVVQEKMLSKESEEIGEYVSKSNVHL